MVARVTIEGDVSEGIGGRNEIMLRFGTFIISFLLFWFIFLLFLQNLSFDSTVKTDL